MENLTLILLFHFYAVRVVSELPKMFISFFSLNAKFLAISLTLEVNISRQLSDFPSGMNAIDHAPNQNKR